MATNKAQLPAKADIFKGLENHNQLLPTQTYWNNVGPMQKVSVETVSISAKPDDGDVYALRDGQYPLTKRGLEKIAHAAGISFHPEFSRVEEHRSDYCRYKAVGAMRKADGTLQIVTGTYFIDLAEDKKGGMSDARLGERRKFIVQLCESGAKNRAIRSLLGLKSHYSPKELARPFAVPRVDFAPDVSDPNVKRFLLEQATGAVSQLYPPLAHHHTNAASSGPRPAALIENGQTEEVPTEREAKLQQAAKAIAKGLGGTFPEDDDLDEALNSGEAPPDELELALATFRTMDPDEQTKTFVELVKRKGLKMGTNEKPTALRMLWRSDRVDAYRRALTEGGE